MTFFFLIPGLFLLIYLLWIEKV